MARESREGGERERVVRERAERVVRESREGGGRERVRLSS